MSSVLPVQVPHKVRVKLPAAECCFASFALVAPIAVYGITSLLTARAHELLMVVSMMLHRMQRPDVCSKHVPTDTASMAVREQVFLPNSPLLAILAHEVSKIVCMISHCSPRLTLQTLVLSALVGCRHKRTAHQSRGTRRVSALTACHGLAVAPLRTALTRELHRRLMLTLQLAT